MQSREPPSSPEPEALPMLGFLETLPFSLPNKTMPLGTAGNLTRVQPLRWGHSFIRNTHKLTTLTHASFHK